MNDYLILAAALTIVLIAYFAKGFSGFGPALISVPMFTLLFDAHTALLTSSLLDLLAGVVLLIPILRQIDWKFVWPVTALLFAGIYLGVHLAIGIDIQILEKVMSLGLGLFVISLLLSREAVVRKDIEKMRWLRYPIALLSGVSGGMIGISGPPLVIFLKMTSPKEYFRTQLIAVFALGPFWRFYWYRNVGMELAINASWLPILLMAMLLGLWLGYKLHLRVTENRFNQIIALLLLIPIIRIWL